MSEFKIGDRVVLLTDDYVGHGANQGATGVVKNFYSSCIGVEFDTKVNGHSLNGELSNRNGLYVTIHSIAPLEDKAEDKMSTIKTGGSTPNQYRLSVNLPLTSDRTQFVDVDLEALDVIDALDLSGNLKDVQKALFRMGKKDGVSDAYDLNKCLFYILREMKKRDIISHAKFWEVSEMLEKILNGRGE